MATSESESEKEKKERKRREKKRAGEELKKKRGDTKR